MYVAPQDRAVSIVKGWIESNNVPHAILLTGPSGTGKTTMARIIAKELGADPPFDLCEVNASADGGVAMVSAISSDMRPSITGSNRVWILDEAQGISSAGQNSFLKLLEEARDYTYFIFCSTDPQKLIPTLTSRCSRIPICSVGEQAMSSVLDRVLQAENRAIPDEVCQKILAYSFGSVRRALVILEQCLAAKDEVAMVSMMTNSQSTQAGIDRLCNMLVSVQGCRWSDVAMAFQHIPDDPEIIRRGILTWFSYRLYGLYRLPVRIDICLLARMLKIFEDSITYSGKSGLGRMVFDAYSVLAGMMQILKTSPIFSEKAGWSRMTDKT